MRISTGTWIRAAFIATAVALAGLHDASSPARADAPGPSFSVDLNAGQAGIQSTRSMPIGTPFSISVVLDTVGVPGYIEVDVKFAWDDAKVTAPLDGVPLDWSDPPEPGPIGGRLLQMLDPECPPFDATDAIQNEDGIGVASLNVGCYVGGFPQPQTSYSGPLWEFVLRCDATGTSDITLDTDLGNTFILPDVQSNSMRDHLHNATITCTPGGGDADSDGMPDVYEEQHLCLNVGIADASADPDSDNWVNITEYAEETNPCDLDTDNDGCADSEEAATNPPIAGGQRDPVNGYDFYDVNGTKKVDSVDIGLVRGNFTGGAQTPLEDVIYDRSPGAAVWAPNGPDQKINAADIALVRASFNHNCQALPN